MKACSTAVVLLVFAFPSWAHDSASWISEGRLKDPVSGAWCCGKDDCQALELSDVVYVGEGYLIKSTKEWIAIDRVIWGTPDGKPWRCWTNNASYSMENEATQCLILPNLGF